MYSATTRAIEVIATPEYAPERSEPARGVFCWSYTIDIVNHSELRVQLLSRHWRIADANGRVEIVEGAGVVGERPILNPDGAYRYTSFCPLPTPSGIMSGHYRMIDETGATFDVEIPAFSLDSPLEKRVLN